MCTHKCKHEIFASVWPLLPGLWPEHLYAVVRVIYPHKASAALWKRCKYGAWYASHLFPHRFYISPVHCSAEWKQPRYVGLKFFNGQTKPVKPFHWRYTKTLKTIPLVGLLYQRMVLPQWNITFLYGNFSLESHFFENVTDMSKQIHLKTLFLFSTDINYTAY